MIHLNCLCELKEYIVCASLCAKKLANRQAWTSARPLLPVLKAVLWLLMCRKLISESRVPLCMLPKAFVASYLPLDLILPASR